jgi:hypothetical protein
MKSLLTLVAFASLAGAETPIAFTRYDDPNPLATMHRSGIRNENIVINKVDATHTGLQQLGRQLYATQVFGQPQTEPLWRTCHDSINCDLVKPG